MTGIDCGTDCTEDVASTATVTLQAFPSTNAAFDGWSGDCIGTGPCVISMKTPRVVIARFVNANMGGGFPLSIGLIGNGHGRVYGNPGLIDCPNRCQDSFPSGTSVTLGYEVPSDSVFEGWGGDCSGMGPCTVSMDRVRHVEARIRLFGPPPTGHPRDVNLDGVPDLVFAAPRLDSGGANAGRVYIALGPIGSMTNASGLSFAYDGAPGSRFGEAIAMPGDMNDDGFADIMVGAPGTSLNGNVGVGAVHMITGGNPPPPRGRIAGMMVPGMPSRVGFGASIAVLPDLDNDGQAELAIGAPGNTNTAGAVFIFMSAQAMNVQSAADASIILNGEHPGDGFGTSVVWVGDVDGNGQGELAVGAVQRLVLGGHRPDDGGGQREVRDIAVVGGRRRQRHARTQHGRHCGQQPRALPAPPNGMRKNHGTQEGPNQAVHLCDTVGGLIEWLGSGRGAKVAKSHFTTTRLMGPLAGR